MSVYQRRILLELDTWRKSPTRKPLILRGARQVGKTTAVEIFGQKYAQFISLNLENKAHAKLFRESKNMAQLVEAIFFLNGKALGHKNNTLIFIDEIQQVPEAIGWLRYFYEDFPELHVILGKG
jgi:uncharacterized protein